MKEYRTVTEILSRWLEGAFGAVLGDQMPESPAVRAVATADPRFGDYQCNAVMGFAKRLKTNPRDLASAVVKALEPNEIVARTEIAGPGFINVTLNNGWLSKHLETMVSNPDLGMPPAGKGKTVVMDYAGPNICKSLHIGHLRSPNIGSALDRIYRSLGYKVIADSHLGDWGTQFGIIIKGYNEFGDDEAMERNPIEELERIYVESYERGEKDPEWREACKQQLVALQSGDSDAMALWERFVELTRTEVDRVYGRLGYKFDLVRGESYYRDVLGGIVDDLESRGIIRESDGALVAFLEDEKLPPAIVRKSDGGFNYATSDIATILSRIEEFEADQIIYVHDERQQLHFSQVFAICRRMGINVDMKLVWFGLMRMAEGTFSTREGNVISLEKLLDEAESRALAMVKASSPEMPEDEQLEVARAVGIGALKYADLSQNPQTLVTFSWDKALALDGNSGPYLQYAYARIASVQDKYNERFPEGDLSGHEIAMEEPVERELAVKLLRFPDVVIAAAENYKPNMVSDYIYDLAQTYSNFYQNVPFLKAEEGVRESRVKLCGVTAAILRKGLDLLGIDAPERI